GYLMDSNCINIPYEETGGRFDEPIEIDPETICLCTGKEDISGKIIYQGDIIESHLSNGQISALNLVIKYGAYKAYCPEDKEYMDSVGFYAEAEGYQDMPIGPTEEYAKVIGNIYDNPELLAE
ncbi:MAG: YopX family protein, partial [Lachnospiraceae bacterium]|nr:YopX family protein [Lachnospiraceae bacterium]